jgi:hypothetical protein
MASTSIKKTPNDWAAVLTAANVKTPDIVPPGFATIEQIAEETGKSITTTRHDMKAAIKSGVVEAKKFLVSVGHKTYPTTHYRIVVRSEVVKGNKK